MKYFILMFVIMISPVNAQWMMDTKDDPFGNDHLTYAYTTEGYRSLGVRCIGDSNLQILFLTEENVSDKDIYSINKMHPRTLIRIDKIPLISINDNFVSSNKGKLVMVAKITPSIVEKMRNAKNRIALAIDMLGDRYSPTGFSPVGSYKNISQVLKACHKAKEKIPEITSSTSK